MVEECKLESVGNPQVDNVDFVVFRQGAHQISTIRVTACIGGDIGEPILVVVVIVELLIDMAKGKDERFPGSVI